MSVMKIFNRSKRLSAGVLMIGLAIGTLIAVPAIAQAALSEAQISAIQTTLKTALNGLTGGGAAEDAIASTMQTAVTLYGSGNISLITSVLLAAAEKQNVDQCALGRGLGKAAGDIAIVNKTGANAVATTLANEGKKLERTCFQTKVTELGYTDLASLAGQDATITGATGGGGGGNGLGGGFPGGGPSGGSGCLNPSCTRL